MLAQSETAMVELKIVNEFGDRWVSAMDLEDSSLPIVIEGIRAGLQHAGYVEGTINKFLPDLSLGSFNNPSDGKANEITRLDNLRVLDKECIWALLELISMCGGEPGPYEWSLVEQTLEQ